MPTVGSYPTPSRPLDDGDIMLGSVDGKTVSVPVAVIAAYMADKIGTGDGGSTGGGSTTVIVSGGLSAPTPWGGTTFGGSGAGSGGTGTGTAGGGSLDFSSSDNSGLIPNL